jgi:hypothetical protein
MAAAGRHDFFNLADLGRELDSPNNTQNDRRRRNMHDSTSSDDSDDDDAIFSRPAARVVTIQPSSCRLKPYVVEESSARCRAKNRTGRAALLTALKAGLEKTHFSVVFCPEAVFRIHEILGWIRIRGSMPLTSGSGFGSWIRIRIRILDPDPAIFVIDLQDTSKELIFNIIFSAYYFLKVHLHHFSKIKSQKEPQNSKNQGFSYFFCMMIEGSGSGFRAGSGSIHLTSGSGSGRPKNMCIRIRIRIRDIAQKREFLGFFFNFKNTLRCIQTINYNHSY